MKEDFHRVSEENTRIVAERDALLSEACSLRALLDRSAHESTSAHAPELTSPSPAAAHAPPITSPRPQSPVSKRDMGVQAGDGPLEEARRCAAELGAPLDTRRAEAWDASTSPLVAMHGPESPGSTLPCSDSGSAPPAARALFTPERASQPATVGRQTQSENSADNGNAWADRDMAASSAGESPAQVDLSWTPASAGAERSVSPPLRTGPDGLPPRLEAAQRCTRLLAEDTAELLAITAELLTVVEELAAARASGAEVCPPRRQRPGVAVTQYRQAPFVTRLCRDPRAQANASSRSVPRCLSGTRW